MYWWHLEIIFLSLIVVCCTKALSRACLPSPASVVLRNLSQFRQTSLRVSSSAGMLKQDKRPKISRGNAAALCSGRKGCRLLCSPPLPCRLVPGESPCEPISITQQQVSTFSFFYYFFFFPWVSFLVFWRIESVNERVQLSARAGTRNEWEAAAGGACTMEKGDRGATVSHAWSRSDLLGVAKT